MSSRWYDIKLQISNEGGTKVSQKGFVIVDIILGNSQFCMTFLSERGELCLVKEL